jgi:hypothetical protein
VATGAGGADEAVTAAAAAEEIEAAAPAVCQAGLSEAEGRVTRAATHPTDCKVTAAAFAFLFLLFLSAFLVMFLLSVTITAILLNKSVDICEGGEGY